MNEKKITQILVQYAVKNYPAEVIQPTVQALADPIIDYFSKQNDLAKMLLINKMLEDLLINKIRTAIFEMYKKINENAKNKGNQEADENKNND